MAKITVVRNLMGVDLGDRAFTCPGCKGGHLFRIGPGGWSFNGDLEKPTVQPSILVNAGLDCPSVPRCHSFITEGLIQFLPDCTHELAGKTVPLPEDD